MMVVWLDKNGQKNQRVSDHLTDVLIQNIRDEGGIVTRTCSETEWYAENPQLIPKPDKKPHDWRYDEYNQVIVYDQAHPWG